MAVCQNLVPLVNIKIAGKWMVIPLKMVLIGIDPYPYIPIQTSIFCSSKQVVAVHSDASIWLLPYVTNLDEFCQWVSQWSPGQLKLRCSIYLCSIN